MLQYQHSALRVLTPFVAQPDGEVTPDSLTGAEPVDYFLGPDWKVSTSDLPGHFPSGFSFHSCLKSLKQLDTELVA